MTLAFLLHYLQLPCKKKLIIILYLMVSSCSVKRLIFILVFLMQQYFQVLTMDNGQKKMPFTKLIHSHKKKIYGLSPANEVNEIFRIL